MKKTKVDCNKENLQLLADFFEKTDKGFEFSDKKQKEMLEKAIKVGNGRIQRVKIDDKDTDNDFYPQRVFY